MRAIINMTPVLYEAHKAEEIAATLNAGDEDGWEYRVVHPPNGKGYSRIDIYDEANEFVGSWG